MLSRDLLSTQRGCTRPQRGHHRGKRQKDKALTPNKPEGPQELGFRNEATHREALHGRDAAGVSPPPSCDGAGRNLPLIFLWVFLWVVPYHSLVLSQNVTGLERVSWLPPPNLSLLSFLFYFFLIAIFKLS